MSSWTSPFATPLRRIPTPTARQITGEVKVECVTDFPGVFRSRRSELLAVADLQADQELALQNEDEDGLLLILARKQQILERLADRRPSSLELQQQWHQARDGVSQEIRQLCDQLLLESQQLAAQLIRREQSALELMQKRRAETLAELEQVSRQLEVQSTYLTAEPTNSLLDLNQ